MAQANRNLIGPRIRYLRKKKDITQESLAAKLQLQGIKIDRPMISKIECQTREVYDFEAFAIARALQIDISELFKDKVVPIRLYNKSEL
jgi:transcriptional regulator with XRE-family HTH domain